MRCKTCDYPLWNLKARQCPECGSAFKTSEFEFAPGAVKFCCPHCDQAYFGTGELGHLNPVNFTCTSCGRQVSMDQMWTVPVGGAESSGLPAMPWLERRRRGVFRAFFHTVGLALVQPGRLMRSVPRSAGVGESLSFGMIIMVAVIILGAIVPMLVAGGFSFGGGAGMFGFFVMSYLVVPGIASLMSLLLLWPMTAHLVLRWTGGCRHSLDRTLIAFGYSAGANIISAVPCAGLYVGWIWWLVSSTLALREAQQVHGGRATVAVLALPVAVIGLTTVLFLAMTAAWSGAGMFGPTATAWTQQNMTLSMLHMQLVQQGTQDPAGAGPMHAIEIEFFGNTMRMGGAAATSPYCQPGTKTSPAGIPVNATTLQSFETMSRSQQLGEVQKLLNSMPPNVVAHRFGDFVFTYHGADLRSRDSNLWTIVMLPDPGANGAPAAGDTIVIGKGDYSVIQTTFGSLPTRVQFQNQHRATLGLPPLPDLSTVTHAAPAVAAPPSAPASPPP